MTSQRQKKPPFLLGILSKYKQGIFRIIFCLFLISVTLIFSELGIRIFFHEKKNYTLEMWRYAQYLKKISTDPAIGHEHIPNSRARLMGVNVSINSNKLREREIQFEKPSGVKRILMLGDSLTFGWGVGFENTSSKVLERELNRDGRKFEVINAGVGNYNTKMEVQYFFSEGKLYSPDIVIINYFINDAESSPSYRRNILNENSQFWVIATAQVDWIFRMLNLGGRTTWKDYYSNLYHEDNHGLRESRRALKKLGSWCEEKSIPCLLVNHPDLHELDPYPFESVNRKVEIIAKEAGLSYFDLLPAVKGESKETLWVTRSDTHPNEKASTIYGKAIFKHLEDSNFL
jgi:hypothetical protein